MTQSSNRIFDEFAKVMTDAAGVAQGVKRELDSILRAQAERILQNLDYVRRDEFDAVQDMAARARDDAEHLEKRVAALEAKLATKSSKS